MRDYASVSGIWSRTPWRIVQYSACEMFTNVVFPAGSSHWMMSRFLTASLRSWSACWGLVSSGVGLRREVL